MISTEYQIDYSDWFDEGGYCQVYPIKYHSKLIFKEFRSRKKALESYKYHKKLETFDLAPKIYSKVCRLEFYPEDDCYQPDPSDWGYVMECVQVGTSKTLTLKQIQNLVDNILKKTGLKFWDCHYFNIGLAKRKGKTKLVCIDTGIESFNSDCNAWGFSSPGPKCNYCDKYQCKCGDY